MQVAIELPNDFVILQPVQEIEREMRLSYALWLFKNGKITISKATKIADMDIYSFISECKKNEISIINITKEELLEEMTI
jgi:predicted HTH domain antitoxin